MRLAAFDYSTQQLASAVSAGACAAGAWVASASEVALQLFGAPLPVVLGSAAGAFLARAYLPEPAGRSGFFRSLAVSVGWVFAGIFVAPLLHALVPVIPGFGQVNLPAGALAGVAGLVAAAPAWAPWLWALPVVRARLGLPAPPPGGADPAPGAAKAAGGDDERR